MNSKTVNSASQDFPTDVLTAAFKQDANAVSDVVTVSNSSTGAATYYIVKTVSKSDKNADWKNYKDDLTKVIINGKKADTNFTNSVIAKVLKKYNVKVVDKSFSAILDQYVTGSGASSMMIKVELPTRSKDPFLRFQRPLRFLARMVVRSVISPRSLLVSYPNLRWIYRVVRVFTFVKN